MSMKKVFVMMAVLLASVTASANDNFKLTGKIDGASNDTLCIDCNDTAEKWAAAVKKHNLPWLQVRSEDGITEEKFRVKGYPYKVLISPEGIVLNAYLGETADFYQYLDSAL